MTFIQSQQKFIDKFIYPLVLSA